MLPSNTSSRSVSQATANSSKKVWDDLGLEQEYLGFSCPLESFNEPFAQMIAGEYARSVLGVFVERFACMFSKSGLDDLKRAGAADPAQIIIAYNVECLPK